MKKSQLIKTFTNAKGRVTWGINLNSNGTFSFINFNRDCYTVSKENLIKGWWEGSIPKKVREFAIQYK